MSEVKISSTKKWLISWWIPLTLLFGPYNFLLFAYAGFTSRNKKLIYMSYVYALPVFFQACNLGTIAHYLCPTLWIAGFIHALLIRNSYINRWIELKDSKNNGQSTEKKGNIENNEIDLQETNTKAVDIISDFMEETSELIDINNCSIEELVKLPFMTLILAKKAIAEREERKGFKDLEEFGTALELKPHMLEKIRPLVKVEEIIQANESLETGRVLDF